MRITELIETLWNVNKDAGRNASGVEKELIETLWNVNVEEVQKLLGHVNELIETLWNVNHFKCEVIRFGI